MLLSYFERRRRRNILARPFPEEWLKLLERNVWQYARLPPPQQARLRDILRILIAEKDWEACGGLEINDEIRVTIAAQAALMLLGFEEFYFDSLHSILVYPETFVVPDEDEGYRDQVGEAHEDGKVVLSWEDVKRAGACACEKVHPVIHELAHELDIVTAEHSEAAASILGASAETVRRWQSVLSEEFDAHFERTSRERRTLLESYAAEDLSEFFAVATEVFFQQPASLRSEHPRLYGVLAEFYRQDPAARLACEAEGVPPETRGSADGGAASRDREIEEYSRILRGRPELADVRRERAMAYLERGDLQSALDDIDEVLTQEADDPLIYVDRAAIHRELGDDDAALEDLSRAIRICPELAIAFVERGYIRLDRSELGEALADFDEALRLDPAEDLALTGRGDVLLEREELAPAIEEYTKAIELHPEDAAAREGRGLAHLKLEHWSEACRDLDAALRLEPDLASSYLYRAEARFRLGDAAAAAADAAAALGLDPELRDAEMWLEKAQAALEKARRGRKDAR
ncbi:MAG: zinc-dependent peptidase [Planctomycetes bacterium]|nr:zinc-dependent peptidase [Planctomycetota bacterium]